MAPDQEFSGKRVGPNLVDRVRDPEITRFLESRGRAGVPLYLWYEPGRDAEELPQILTPSMLIDRARRPRR